MCQSLCKVLWQTLSYFIILFSASFRLEISSSHASPVFPLEKHFKLDIIFKTIIKDFCCCCRWLFYSLVLHSKNTKFRVLKQPLYYSWLSVNWTGLGKGRSPLLHAVLPGTAWNTQGGLAHASNVGVACRLRLLYSPRGLLLQQCSLGFFSLVAELSSCKSGSCKSS